MRVARVIAVNALAMAATSCLSLLRERSDIATTLRKLPTMSQALDRVT